MPDLTVKELKEKSDDDLLERYNHNTTHGDKIKIILEARIIDRLISSLNENSKSSNELSKKIVWLTRIIAIATVIYTIATVVALFN